MGGRRPSEAPQRHGAGAWFLTREVEFSAAVADAIERMFSAPGVPHVRFHLPASKTDVRNTGTVCDHGCPCGRSPSPVCTAHAAWSQLDFQRRQFLSEGRGRRTDASVPLLLPPRGEACAKEAMPAKICHATSLLGVELAALDGSERVSGHSLRTTGVQGLAAAGVDTWAVELVGRWGSTAVRGYIQDARLVDATSYARHTVSAEPLEDLVRRLISEASASEAVDLLAPQPAAREEAESLMSLPGISEPLAEMLPLQMRTLARASNGGVATSSTASPAWRTGHRWGLEAGRLRAGWPLAAGASVSRRGRTWPRRRTSLPATDSFASAACVACALSFWHLLSAGSVWGGRRLAGSRPPHSSARISLVHSTRQGGNGARVVG